MKKPSKEMIWLAEYYIVGVIVDYNATNIDKAETIVTVYGCGGGQRHEVKMKSDEFLKYCDLRIDYNSIACLNDHYQKIYDDWEEWSVENALDVQEFHRLKKKLRM